jgi:hypothetical protein
MPHRGFEITSSWSGVRRSNQIASWPVELVFISGGFYSIVQLTSIKLVTLIFYRSKQLSDLRIQGRCPFNLKQNSFSRKLRAILPKTAAVSSLFNIDLHTSPPKEQPPFYPWTRASWGRPCQANPLSFENASPWNLPHHFYSYTRQQVLIIFTKNPLNIYNLVSFK